MKLCNSNKNMTASFKSKGFKALLVAQFRGYGLRVEVNL